MINKLMIVAHPDDETLFGGGELIKHAKEYKVICLDYGNHITRHLEFLRAMQMIGVEKWEHWDGEPYKTSAAYNESILIPRIERVLDEQNWDMVVTHNQGGEYGHYRHVSTHNVMARLCPEKLYVFNTDLTTRLPDDILHKKHEVLSTAYQSQYNVLKWFRWEYEILTKYQ